MATVSTFASGSFRASGICCLRSGEIAFVETMQNRVKAVNSKGSFRFLAGNQSDIQAFNLPWGICEANEPDGKVIIADSFNHKIVSIQDGILTVVAGTGLPGNSDGNSSVAAFNCPRGVCCDFDGNIIVADRDNHCIRKIDKNGQVSTIAGSIKGNNDGIGADASFFWPSDVKMDCQGNIVIADSGNNIIRKIDHEGRVQTIAGNGSSGKTNGDALKKATFNNPISVCVDGHNNIFISDRDNHMIRVLSPKGVVSTLAGTGDRGKSNGSGRKATFNEPRGICFDLEGRIIVADAENQCFRAITLDLEDGRLKTIMQTNRKPKEKKPQVLDPSLKVPLEEFSESSCFADQSFVSTSHSSLLTANATFYPSTTYSPQASTHSQTPPHYIHVPSPSPTHQPFQPVYNMTPSFHQPPTFHPPQYYYVPPEQINQQQATYTSTPQYAIYPKPPDYLSS